MPKIVIIDYGMANVASIANMLKKTGNDSVISSDPDIVENATKLILPGIGTYDEGMQALESRNLLDVLQFKTIEEKVPTLGICLGAQLMAQGSEEGSSPGLGWLPAKVKRFRFESTTDTIKIPHMGWNYIKETKQHTILQNILQPTRFYFLHSYHFETNDRTIILCETEYGYSFPSGLSQNNIIALQFHPEKSHRFGLKLISNFADSS